MQKPETAVQDTAGTIEELNAPVENVKKEENDEIEFTVLDTSFTYGEPRVGQ